MENWESLESLGFPGYMVSDQGRVKNERTEKLLALSSNQFGVVRIGLMNREQNRQVTLSLPRLVATMFVTGKSAQFNTPINLDGDRENNNASNLLWRPRWFAVNFFRQYDENKMPVFEGRIYDVETSKEYEGSRKAAAKHGLLEEDILLSVANGSPCFPTWQRFARVSH